MKIFYLIAKIFSLRCNLKGAKVLKFYPLLGAVKIFVLMGVDPLASTSMTTEKCLKIVAT